MKKTLLLMLICGAMLSASAQDSTNSTTSNNTSTTTTTTAHKYYYYPSANVYFDEATGNYWYKDNGATDWTEAQTLPSSVTVDNTQRYALDYNGSEPWQNNATDIKKYKTKGNGAVKIKTEKHK